jgi:hypothetical protein
MTMSGTKRKRHVARDEIPLEHLVEMFQDSQGNWRVTNSIRRGFISFDVSATVSPSGQLYPSLSPKNQLLRLAIVLRACLKHGGYPTDEEYVWISYDGKDWKPDNERPDEPEPGEPVKLRSWYEQLVSSTESLSKPRIRGDLLHALDQLLRRNLPPDVLQDIINAMTTFGRWCLNGDVNRLALRGRETEKSLAAGPKERGRRSAETLVLICKHAEEYWRRKAAMRGNKTITAEEIAADVNTELRSLGRKVLRPKTIADYVSKGISGQLLRTG